MPTSVYIKRGRVKPLVHRHPWVFASSIDRVEGEVGLGSVVDVRDFKGRFLLRGFYNEHSALRVRAFAFDEKTTADDAWIRDRLVEAVTYRREILGLPSAETNAYRLIHGDADLLPGLVVDVLGSVVALQISSAGLDRFREPIIRAIEGLLSPSAIVESQDLKTRAKEGLPPAGGLLRGSLGEGPHQILEHGIRYEVSPLGGQKTGFFCDQRENRARFGALARGRRVLDGFCYTGGFGLNAARGGAERVDAVDSSAAAIELATGNAERNSAAIAFHKSDVFAKLSAWRTEGRTFDLAVLDPPKYARARRDLPKALAKYRELFSLGVSVVAPGGVLVCCTCSGLVSDNEFEQMLREVVRHSGRDLLIFHRGEQAPDHPVAATCPEGRYLRAWFCRVR
ncbi:MAG: class I SAM-dependent rRNA methyltransferase [Planctomycetota bacterium]